MNTGSVTGSTWKSEEVGQSIGEQAPGMRAGDRNQRPQRMGIPAWREATKNLSNHQAQGRASMRQGP